jgi:hypothetical protein
MKPTHEQRPSLRWLLPAALFIVSAVLMGVGLCLSAERMTDAGMGLFSGSVMIGLWLT